MKHAMDNNYKNQKFGFDRTQMFKEHEAPMIRRQSALNAAQTFYENNNVEYSGTELKALYKRFLTLIETGDDSFFSNLDSFIESKKKKQETGL